MASSPCERRSGGIFCRPFRAWRVNAASTQGSRPGLLSGRPLRGLCKEAGKEELMWRIQGYSLDARFAGFARKFFSLISIDGKQAGGRGNTVVGVKSDHGEAAPGTITRAWSKMGSITNSKRYQSPTALLGRQSRARDLCQPL